MIKKRVLTVLVLTGLFSALNGSAQDSAEIDSLSRQLKLAKEDTLKVKLLVELGNAYAFTDLDKSIGYLKQGYQLSAQLSYPFGLARNAYLLGVSYTDASQYTTADSFISIAQAAFAKLGSIKDLAKVENAWGSIMFKQGNYWAAGSHFSRSAEMFDQVKDTTYSLVAYQNLIAVLGRAKNYEKAVTQSKKVLRIVESRGDSTGIAYALQGLITDLTYLKKFDEAFTYLKRALDLANTSGNHGIAAEIYSAVGGYYYARSNYANALNYFKTAMDKAEKMGDTFGVTNHHNSIGQCYYLLGDYANAREHLLKGMELAKKYNNRIGIQNISGSLSSLYDSTRDYRNAYRYLLEHTLMKDSILNGEIRSYTSSLEAQYESNKKENEILRLRQQEEEKNYQISRRNYTIIAAAGLIIALSIMFYLVARNFRNKQRLEQERSALLEERVKTMEKEKQISSLQSMINGQESERTRVARDLHDGVGGLLSTVKMYYTSLHHETPDLKTNPLYPKTASLINDAAEEIRKVAHNMMPEVLMKMGLADALKDLCNNISAGKTLRVRCEAYGTDKRVDGFIEIMLFRIVQELTNNIIKHAQATDVLIQLNQDDDRLSLVVEDNGKGFDVAAASSTRSMGMTTVKNRVTYLQGELSIDSQEGIGTTVTIEVPLNIS